MQKAITFIEKMEKEGKPWRMLLLGKINQEQGPSKQ